MANFNGFPPGLFTFFSELKANNDRAWFEDNRRRYEQDVKEPLADFVAAMAPELAKVSPHIQADPKKSPFRIHRDVRFSKDKSPYKTHAAAQFRHRAGKDAHAPGFYVHLEPGSIVYGGGVWRPPSDALASIREDIAEKSSAWRKATESSAIKKMFGGLREGDPLTRAPKGYAPDHPMIDDLKKRSFFVMADGDEASATSPRFTKNVAAAFSTAAPVLRFLTEAVGQPF